MSNEIRKAWQDLAAGRPHEAYATFTRELPLWAAGSPSAPQYVDCARGVILSALFEKDDAKAKAALTAIVSGDSEPKGDALFFAGQTAAALRAYRDATFDNAVVDPRPHQPDRVIAAGVSFALKGDWFNAIRAWSQPAVGAGPYDLTDEQTALVGIAFAVLHEWPQAEAAWISASRMTRIIPQMGSFWPGNITGLSMLYRYRTKFARGEHQYTWPQWVQGSIPPTTHTWVPVHFP
ncbi:MAG: hypothetical protein JO101_08715 [Candidatus Eremiobacteraeota bacterium]|nr:hypothetical protein [Candidatus Eremiobacteraeota bacterium]MBV8355386.1 hypothetical protein [Candidatus Eremiobacteraeota bacterium]